MVKCTLEYEGGLHCRLEHGPSGAVVSTDAPVDNHGKGESFSPTDLMCVATAACMTTIMGIYAQEHGLDLRGLRMEVVKEMAANPRRIAKIGIDIYVPLAEENPYAEELERCCVSSPAMQSLNAEVKVERRWHREG